MKGGKFMLTNIFYYDFYKPYIFKNEKLTQKYPFTYSQSSDKTGSILSDESSEKEYSFFLNKTFKNEVVNYAETISSDLNSIKNSVKNIINKINDNYFNYSSKLESLKNELSEFVTKYNSYKDFVQENYKHSPLLSNFSDSLRFRVENNQTVLSKFGVYYNDEMNEMSFDEEFFDSLSTKDIVSDISELFNLCEDIYDDTCEIMTVPMEEHMNFKSLNYYYNYIFSNENHNTVKIIETGMLVDISL